MTNVDAKALAEKHLSRSANVKNELCNQSDTIARIADSIVATCSSGGTVYACGNGGSTCDAMHLVEELVARYSRERPGIRAQHFCDPSTITCWANDYEFDSVFERQVKTFLNKNDILVAFSTSGNSENIVRALKAAKEIGAKTIVLSGKDGGKSKSLASECLIVPSESTAHIQESHIAVVHILCEHLENSLFPA
jgi:D-sedoheptulose 7-phosphate isomerase